MLPEESSVTNWVGQLQAGNMDAAQKLWERYFRRLVGLARVKLGDLPRRVADEEDVALSAFNSFYQGVTQGRFPKLDDRDNLWRLLVTITARKAYQLQLHEGRQKRGGTAVRDEAALAGANADGAGLEQFIGPEPTPEFAAQAAEEYQRLLDTLPDADWQALVRWKMEAYTNEEISRKMNCSLHTIERRLNIIRKLWKQHQDD